MKKYVADWIVTENKRINHDHFLLKVALNESLPEMMPGQFVQIKIADSPNTFLRRPISIHYADPLNNEIGLLIQLVGAGTRKLAELRKNSRLNLVFPLGNGFSLPDKSPSIKRFLLIGGGAGVAPLYFLGSALLRLGHTPVFLIGAKTAEDLLLIEEYEQLGAVHLTTEDGKVGEKGFVTNHSLLKTNSFDGIYTCGPLPMMQAVAAYAKSFNYPCEVSLENRMACGIGACLCCVENTVSGNRCICTEGPVMNIEQLTWQI
ncbi:MAG: dihydroorotate dehydrogenase electron transfer subunit [Dysgonamonadaceae bacterium]|jgi:dihydroorotate dehydrogenase electron transfer subunit|nr:dihydroorotate dehydrogenase electron transfer subunit [Dysgonamonadaceae bacterium]